MSLLSFSESVSSDDDEEDIVIKKKPSALWRMNALSDKQVATLMTEIDPGFQEIATLEQGRSFGEHALLHKRPRNANIVSLAHTVLAVLSWDDFETFLSKQEKVNQTSKINFFWEFPYFKHLTLQSLAKLTYGIERI